MIYWMSGDTNGAKYEVSIKLLDFLKTEKVNWRRSVFYISNNNLSNTDNNIQSKIDAITEFIKIEGIDTIVNLNNCHIPNNLSSKNCVEIYVGKIIPTNTTHNLIFLNTYHTQSKLLFTTLVSELQNREII
jgi:hypothetical protein